MRLKLQCLCIGVRSNYYLCEAPFLGLALMLLLTVSPRRSAYQILYSLSLYEWGACIMLSING